MLGLRRLNNAGSSSSPAVEADTSQLFHLVRQLSAHNPEPVPERSPLMNGRWVLLYTTSTTPPAGAGGPGTAEEARVFSPFQDISGLMYKVFYQYAPILAGSAVGKRGSLPGPAGGIRSRGNFQVFDLQAGIVENQARFEAFGRSGRISVWGTAEVVAAGPSQPPCLKAVFTRFEIAVEGYPSLQLPLAVPNLLQGGRLVGPTGYVTTSYLDSELRISRGDKGSLFIAARDRASSSST
ncbi:hypothetical protein V8C86DRAFT_56886 [Haematococcus lacustris]